MYKSEVKGKGGIIARVVADSVNEEENRITTFELEYHRFIHSELMTHRLFSRNAMSSRAVPIDKMIEQVRNSPATPIHWGANQSGMQADKECTNLIDLGAPVEFTADEVWKNSASYSASKYAQAMSEAGYHKQIVNRLLEPFQMMKVVLTATEFDNFFWLRCDPDAQPEIQELAQCMYTAMQNSSPEMLKEGEWHTPYVDHIPYKERFIYSVDGYSSLTEEEAIAISSSCCAQVSYRNIDNSFEKAMKVYERLGVGSSKIHASPFEHVAKPICFEEFDLGFEGQPLLFDMPEGVTHMDREGYMWSGNFKGWVQHRQLLENHTCWKYKGE